MENKSFNYKYTDNNIKQNNNIFSDNVSDNKNIEREIRYEMNMDRMNERRFKQQQKRNEKFEGWKKEYLEDGKFEEKWDCQKCKRFCYSDEEE